MFPVHNEQSIHGERRKWAGEGYRQAGTDQGSDKVSRFKGRGFLVNVTEAGKQGMKQH